MTTVHQLTDAFVPVTLMREDSPWKLLEQVTGERSSVHDVTERERAFLRELFADFRAAGGTIDDKVLELVRRYLLISRVWDACAYAYAELDAGSAEWEMVKRVGDELLGWKRMIVESRFGLGE